LIINLINLPKYNNIITPDMKFKIYKICIDNGYDINNIKYKISSNLDEYNKKLEEYYNDNKNKIIIKKNQIHNITNFGIDNVVLFNILDNLTLESFEFIKYIISQLQYVEIVDDTGISLITNILYYYYIKVKDKIFKEKYIDLFNICIKKVKNINFTNQDNNGILNNYLLSMCKYVIQSNSYDDKNNIYFITQLLEKGININYITNNDYYTNNYNKIISVNNTALSKLIYYDILENKSDINFDKYFHIIKLLIDNGSYISIVQDNITLDLLSKLSPKNKSLIVDYYNKHMLKSTINTINFNNNPKTTSNLNLDNNIVIELINGEFIYLKNIKTIHY
ncbi:MAG: hypothetical protein KIT69_16735, partial [Propionibacteriaceae bacterium]|nr:hypothetical protein [Propionibacteriaceae bacterium]